MDQMARDLAHLSDEAVVALAARSDEVAFAELYDRYGRAAYGLAVRVLRDEALAEDAVQEAFLAIWRGASRFIPERGKAWQESHQSKESKKLQKQEGKELDPKKLLKPDDGR